MLRTALVIFVLSALVGVHCVLVDGEDVDLQKLSDKLPSDLVNRLNGLPKEEEAKRLFREKCLKQSGTEDAYERATAAKDVLKDCVMGLINMEELQHEMEEAKPTGDLDLVFKKYCRKTPELKQCVFNFTETLEPCLDEQERENKKIVQNITDSLADFICYKEGDRIALFIAEGGPDCLNSKQEEIKTCINTTMGKYAPSEKISVENLPKLLLNTEQCHDLMDLQICVVKALEQCDEPTPANIVESLFKFIRNQTPCASMPETAHSTGDKPNSRSTNGATGLTSVLAATIILGVSAYLM